MPAPFTIFNPVTGKPLATFDANGDLYLHGEVTVSGLISTDGRSILPGSNPAADGAVTSVNGMTGAVVLTAASLSALAAANNLSDVASEASARANLGLGQALIPQEVTAAGGYTLVNSAETILTWTPPNDGQQHVFMVFGQLVVSSGATGGALSVSFTDPGGTARTPTLLATSQTTGFHSLTSVPVVCEANEPVSLTQAALSVGAAVLYAAIVGA